MINKTIAEFAESLTERYRKQIGIEDNLSWNNDKNTTGMLVAGSGIVSGRGGSLDDKANKERSARKGVEQTYEDVRKRKMDKLGNRYRAKRTLIPKALLDKTLGQEYLDEDHTLTT
jgi:hypothetical protein